MHKIDPQAARRILNFISSHKHAKQKYVVLLTAPEAAFMIDRIPGASLEDLQIQHEVKQVSYQVNTALNVIVEVTANKAQQMSLVVHLNVKKNE